jgi:hypothetical protein
MESSGLWQQQHSAGSNPRGLTSAHYLKRRRRARWLVRRGARKRILGKKNKCVGTIFMRMSKEHWRSVPRGLTRPEGFTPPTLGCEFPAKSVRPRQTGLNLWASNPSAFVRGSDSTAIDVKLAVSTSCVYRARIAAPMSVVGFTIRP